MSAVPILSGTYADATGDYRTSYPRNLVPVPKATGISNEYLRPADGIVSIGTGPGTDRGGILWNDVHYRVMGTKLVSVTDAGVVTILGDVQGEGQVTLDYGFDRLAIASNGKLWYWNGSALSQVTDPDLGTVLDVKWLSGYFMTTDGANLVVTELADPTQVNPLKYGSSESDPDPVLAIDELRNEAWALNRYTIEGFTNIGGDLFPFRRIDGAQVPRGIVGTHSYVNTRSTFVFMGGGRNESVAVYAMTPGDTEKLSTREIDIVLSEYTEDQLATVVAEHRVDKNHAFVLFHLPDQCLVYDMRASQAAQQPIWFNLVSSTYERGTYKARNLVLTDAGWLAGDPTSASIGVLSSEVSSHYGAAVAWEFGTTILYPAGNDGIIHELELVALTGRVSSTVDPVIWTSYSHDGETWSDEKPTRAGRQGQRMQRICWRQQGVIRNQRMQKFRGTSDAHISMSRLEVSIEPLQTKQYG